MRLADNTYTIGIAIITEYVFNWTGNKRKPLDKTLLNKLV